MTGSSVGRSVTLVALVLFGGVLMNGCHPEKTQSPRPEEARWASLAEQMVDQQIAARDVRSTAVLEAMRKVPRHRFVPTSYRNEAYRDSPLPIADGQTISQPYIVALMSELLEVGPGDKVLEIGTGSGYQAAVLAAMEVEVYSIEIKPGLCESARELLAELGYVRAHVRCGDGYRGWPEEAPFDGIIVTAAPDRIPEPLLDQLGDGAKMVIPVGSFYQELKVIVRNGDQFSSSNAIAVRFVPMTGEIEQH